MKLDEMMANAYMSQKDDGKGFKKFSDAIPKDGFRKKSVIQNQSGFQMQSSPTPQNGANPQNANDSQKQAAAKNANGFQKQTDLPKDKDSVYRRVAKFLVMIGEDEAAKILPHLSEDQIVKIVPEIASVRSVSPEERSVILAEFNGLIEQSKEEGGVATAREMLIKAYGPERAEEMLKKAVPFGSGKPFEYLKDSDVDRIYQLIKDEGDGVQTIVLTHLEPKKAAAVINSMTPDEKKNVVLRMAKMESISPEVLRRVDKSLHEKSLRTTAERSENIDGRNALAQILKRMSSETEKEILTNLSYVDSALSDEIKDRLFTLDDVIGADNKVIQRRLHEMTDEEIVYLIGGKSEEFREKILTNISINRRSQVMSEEDILKPLKKTNVDRATEDFMTFLKRVYDEGSLKIIGRNDTEYV